MLVDSDDQVEVQAPPLWKQLVLPILLLECVVAVYAYAYVQQENVFNWGAANSYQAWTQVIKATLLSQSWWTTPIVVLYSTHMQHNCFYTVPLLPFSALFGDSRAVYVVSLAVLYLVPYALMMGALATQFVKGDRMRVFWTTVFVTLSIPAVWAPALRGLPDHAAAVVTGLAIYLYLARSATISLRRLVAIGLLLGFAPLVRRHYLYSDVAFFVAAAMHQIQLCRMQTSSPMKDNLINAAKRLGIIALSTVGLLCSLGILFVIDLVNHNYPRLYEAFHATYNEATSYYMTSFGIMLWLMAGLGMLLGAIQKNQKQPMGNFVSTFAVVNILIWLVAVRQLAVHYTIFFDWFVVFGIVLLITQTMENRSNKGIFAAIFIALLLSINMTIGLAPDSVLKMLPFKPTKLGLVMVPEQKGDPVSKIFSANYGPRTRNDVPEVLSLTRFLHEHTTAKDQVFIGVVSDVFHADILKNAERMLYGMKGPYISGLSAPSVDSQDSYPLEFLLKANYVVLAHPTSFYIKEADEDVLKVATTVFDQKWDFASDFEQLPEHFKLGKDTEITIYKRIRPTSIQTIVSTLDKITRAIPETPGGQSPIVSTGEQPSEKLDTDQTKRSQFSFDLANYPNHTAYLISAKQMNGPVTMSGVIEPRDGGAVPMWIKVVLGGKDQKIPNANLTMSFYNADGQLDLQNSNKSAKVDEHGNFELGGDAHNEYVVVEITAPGNSQAKLTLENVKLRQHSR